MEVNRELSSLIERAWSLHGKLDFEIQQSGVNLCRFCSQNGYKHCDIAYQNPVVESERLIAIRDSIKEVENILLFLQKSQSWHENERAQALIRLEESRLALMELVRACQGKKVPAVLRELDSCFGDENGVMVLNLKARLKRPERNDQPGLPNKCSVLSLVRMLVMNWKWKHAIWISVKFLFLSASISSMAKIRDKRNLYSNNARRRVPLLTSDSTKAEMRESLLVISRNPLDVFQARG